MDYPTTSGPERRFPELGAKAQRGSKPRCHLLTSGPPDIVAKRLTAIAEPFATVHGQQDQWMPCGFDDVREATLPEAERLLPSNVRQELKRWWLTVSTPATRTPNWDIASTCTIDGKPGLLLIEAKAHDQELIREEAGRKSIDVTDANANARRNLLRIDWALRDASVALAAETGLRWDLSCDRCYQMSNRFAWAWKLTDLGVPVAMVYLGFLNAVEMGGNGSNPIGDDATWEAMVKTHSRALCPADVWDRQWPLKGTPLVPLIRSREISFH